MEITKGIIGNALTSAATDHVVAVANDIYDENAGKYQNEINETVQNIVDNNTDIKIFNVTSNSDNTELFEYYANNPNGTYIKFNDLDIKLVSKIVKHNTDNNELRGDLVFNQNMCLLLPIVGKHYFHKTTQYLNLISTSNIPTNKIINKAITTEKLSDEVNARIDKLKVFEVTTTSDNAELLNYCAENSDNLSNVIILWTDSNNKTYLLSISSYGNDIITTTSYIVDNYLRFVVISTNNINLSEIKINGSEILNSSISEQKLSTDIQDKLNKFKVFNIIQGEIFDAKPLHDFLDADENNLNKVIIKYCRNNNTYLTTINKIIEYDIYTTQFIYNGVISVLHIHPDGNYYCVDNNINGNNIINNSITKLKLDNAAKQPYTQYSFNDIDDLKEVGTYVIAEYNSGQVPVVMSVALEPNGYINQTIFDRTVGIFKRRFFNTSTNTWSIWQEITIEGTKIKNKSITKNQLADDVLPKNTSDLVNDSDFATNNEVESAIQRIVGAAPEALDTLEEIANKLNDSDDVHAALVNSISEKATKVELTNLENSLGDQIKIFDINNTDNSALFTYVEENGVNDVYVRCVTTTNINIILKCIEFNTNTNLIRTDRYVDIDNYLKYILIDHNSYSVVSSILAEGSISPLPTHKIKDKAITPAKLSDETLALIPDLVTFDVTANSDNTALFDYVSKDPLNFPKVIINYSFDANYNILLSIFNCDLVNNILYTNSFIYNGNTYKLLIKIDNTTLALSQLQTGSYLDKSITSNKLEQSVQDQLNSFKVFRFIYNDVEHNKAEHARCLEYYNNTNNTSNIILIFDNYNSSTGTKYEGVIVTGIDTVNADIISSIPFAEYNGASVTLNKLNIKSSGVYSKTLTKYAGNNIYPETILTSALQNGCVTEDKLATSLKEKINSSEFFVIEVDESNTVSNLSELSNLIDYGGPEGDRPIGITKACIIKENNSYYPVLKYSGTIILYRINGSIKYIDVLDGSVGYSDFAYINDSDIKDNSITINKIQNNAVTESKLSTEVQTKINNYQTFIIDSDTEANATKFTTIKSLLDSGKRDIVIISKGNNEDLVGYISMCTSTKIEIKGFLTNKAVNSITLGYCSLLSDGTHSINNYCSIEGTLILNNTITNNKLNTEVFTEIDNRIINKLSTIIGGAPESFDTLKEIADWIETHGDTAVTMQNGITTNSNNITALTNRVQTLESNIATVDEVNEILNEL